jgi:hypothetical protein
MTVSSTTNRISYTGNGSTTAFAFAYYFQSTSDLKVLKVLISTGVGTLQTLTTDYTISGTTSNGVYPNGGTVNMVSAPSSLYQIVIYREPNLTQTIDLVENDALPAETLEQGLDKAIIISQRLDERLDRAIVLNDSFTATFDPTLPVTINTANSVLVVNAAGDGWDVGPTTTEIEDAEAEATAAAASAAAALVSETAAAASAASAAAYANASAWDDVAYKVFSDSPITLVDADSGTLYEIDCTSGNVVVNLPTIAGLSLTGPWSATFKKTDSSSNTITLTRASTDTIDGSTTKVISRQYSAVVLVPDTDAAPDKWTSLTFGETGSILGPLVGTTDTQTLSAKTFSDAVTIAEIATPSTPSSGFGKIYFKAGGKAYTLNDDGTETEVGAGGGGINYLSANPDAESGVTGYAAYADAAATSPVDMNGGSPTTTITRTTSSPLRGTGSFLITKDAANRQGEGASYAFTIASADTYQMLQISFEYLASANFVDDDVRIYVYDVTNSTLIEPIGRDLKANTLGGKHYAYFQTTSSTSYSVGFHVASTNASAYTIKYDTIVVGPSQLAKGAMVSDWVSFTPTSSWVSNATHTGKKRRIGDSIEYDITIVLTGAPTSATLVVTIPDTIDTTKLSHTTLSNYNIVGECTIFDAGTATYTSSQIAGNSTTGLQPVYDTGAGTIASITQAAPITFASGDVVRLKTWAIPIVGLSSGISVASESTNRVIAFQASLTATSYTSATTNKSPFNNAVVNIGGAFDTANNRFVCPVSGNYRFSVNNAYSRNTGGTFITACSTWLYKNGSAQTTLQTESFSTSMFTTKAQSGSVVVSAVKGDYFEIFHNASVSSGQFEIDGASKFSGELILGNQTIGMDEVVAARYTSNSGQAMGTSLTDLEFEDKTYDTHNAYNISTGIYTIPVAGYYRVNASFLIDSVTLATTAGLAIGIVVNGTLQKNSIVRGSGGATSFYVETSDLLNLVAGDQLKIQGLNSNSTAMNTVTAYNVFNINRTK